MCKIFFKTIKNWLDGRATNGTGGRAERQRRADIRAGNKKKRYKLSFNRHLYLFFSKAFIAPRGRESLGLYLGEDLC